MADDQNGADHPAMRAGFHPEGDDHFWLGQIWARLGELDRMMTDFKEGTAKSVEDNQVKLFESIRDIGDAIAEIQDRQAIHAKKIDRVYNVLTAADAISGGAKMALPFVGLAAGIYGFYEWVIHHVVGKP